jgi:hypothetical protein
MTGYLLLLEHCDFVAWQIGFGLYDQLRSFIVKDEIGGLLWQQAQVPAQLR